MIEATVLDQAATHYDLERYPGGVGLVVARSALSRLTEREFNTGLVDFNVTDPDRVPNYKIFRGLERAEETYAELASSLSEDEPFADIVGLAISADRMRIRDLQGKKPAYDEYTEATVGLSVKPVPEDEVQRLKSDF